MNSQSADTINQIDCAFHPLSALADLCQTAEERAVSPQDIAELLRLAIDRSKEKVAEICTTKRT